MFFLSLKVVPGLHGESLLSRPDPADGFKKTTSLGAALAWTRDLAVHLV